MQNERLIVIGASAGGIPALSRLVSFFPADFKGIILIVLHLSPSYKSRLSAILQRHTFLSVRTPKKYEEIVAGHIYIAPPNVHMCLSDGKIMLRHGPKINNTRPAIDALFYSAALSHGPLVIGIILSGLLDDGSAGLLAIKKCQGVTIVQEPEEADFPGMPNNALKTGSVDYRLPVDKMYPIIQKIMDSKPPENIKTEFWDALEIESQLNYTENLLGGELLKKISTPSQFSCPECAGVLWKVHDDSMIRYRCRVGHAFGKAGLINYKNDVIEEFLWKALRGLEEKEVLLKSEQNGDTEKELNQIKKNKEYLKRILLTIT